MNLLVLVSHLKIAKQASGDLRRGLQTQRGPGRKLIHKVVNGKTLSLALMTHHSVGVNLASVKNMMLHQMDLNGRDHLKWDRAYRRHLHFLESLVSLSPKE